ncbi:alpha/beta fold hydrolase [uncultured Microbacterium sp.]|uniref:alpha/beta fold hydrolase n=1 Tax=uncultured Microbacterium sp. TaxID=191216 RepID=UPI0035CB2D6B
MTDERATDERATDERATVLAEDGTPIVVHITGPDAGVPVVLLHGVGSSSVTYDWLLPDLEGRRVYRVDHRGHGDSGRKDGTYTLPFYFDDAVRVLEELVGRPAVLAGFSLGGMVAWRIAQRRPDLVRGVFLEDPIVFIEKTYQGPLPEILRGTIEQEKSWAARGLTLDEATEELGRNPAGPDLTMADVLQPDGLRGLALSTIKRDRGTMEAAIDSSMSQGIDTTSPLLVPALVLAAGDEGGAAFPTEDAAVIARSHPDIELHKVYDAGHQVHNSFAGREIYHDLLLEFIRRFDD